MKDIKVQIKPEFSFKNNFIRLLIYGLMFLIIYALILDEFKTFNEYPIILILYLICLLVFCFVKSLIDKKHSKKYVYNFYIDRLGYIDNYYLKKEKIIMYDDIENIIMYQTKFEKENNTGTIKINFKNKKYMRIKEVENIINTHKEIIKLINKYN